MTFKIALLDDRKSLRESTAIAVQDGLDDGWECIVCPLLPRSSDYPKWLMDNSICVLLLDQRLNEKADDSERPVDYRGDQVLSLLRTSIPDLPIFMVTQHLDDIELTSHAGSAEAIVPRSDLFDDPTVFGQRFMRAGASFSKRMNEELTEFGRLSEAAALSKASDDELARLKAIQVSHLNGLPDFSLESDRLSKLESQIERIDQMIKQISTYLSNAKLPKSTN